MNWLFEKVGKDKIGTQNFSWEIETNAHYWDENINLLTRAENPAEKGKLKNFKLIRKIEKTVSVITLRHQYVCPFELATQASLLRLRSWLLVAAWLRPEINNQAQVCPTLPSHF